MKAFTWVALSFLVFPVIVGASPLHPRLLCSDGDRAAILEKIATLDWARKSFEGIKAGVEPWANRHLTDPEFLLSRLPMHWVEGRRHTQTFYNNTTTKVTNFGGNAPYPTLRLGDQRAGTNAKGVYYIAPDLDQLPAYNTDGLWFMNTKAGEDKEWANPGVLFTSRLGQFMNLAAQSAFLYWLTGQEKYGRMAADVLCVVAKSVPPLAISGPTAPGVIGFQALEDSNLTESFPFLYDFIYDYLVASQGRLTTTLRPPESAPVTYAIGTNQDIHRTLERFMSNYARVIPAMKNNHNAVRASGMVNCTLAHDDPALRATYFSNFTTVSNTHIYPLWWMVSNNFNDEMTWTEPGSYGNYPLGVLLPACFIAERAGFPAFARFPALLTSPISFDRSTFPNGLFPQYGDDGSASFSPALVELMLAQATLLGHSPARSRLARVMRTLVQNGYNRVSSGGMAGIRHLATSLAQTPGAEEGSLDVTGEVDFATYTSQRNGTDPRLALMFGVYGGGGTNFQYSHSPAKGMSLSLYGRGHVLGPDAGAYSPYEAPIFLRYYTRPAGANTVIVNGNSQTIDRSRSMRLWSGNRVNPILRNAVEPAPGQRPVCTQASFVDLSWTDGTNGLTPAQSTALSITNTPHVARQRRVTGIIRTSVFSGYYIDIYRSKWLSGDATIPGNADLTEKYHDYLYHNLGWDGVRSLSFQSPSGEGIPTAPTAIPGTNDVTPGFFSPGQEFFTEKEAVATTNTLVASFDFAPIGMNAWSLGQEGRTFVRMSAPVSSLQPAAMKAVQNNNTGIMPAMLIRQTGEAWERPFVVVYEPFESGGSTIARVRRLAGAPASNDLVAFAVESKPLSPELHGRVERVFCATNAARTNLLPGEGFTFRGTYGVWAENASGFLYAYLGNSSSLSRTSGPGIRIASGGTGRATLRREGNAHYYSADVAVTVTLEVSGSSTLALSNMTLYTVAGGVVIEGTARTFAMGENPNRGTLTATLPPATEGRLLVGAVGRGGQTHQGSVSFRINGVATTDRKIQVGRRDQVEIRVDDPAGQRPEFAVLLRSGRPMTGIPCQQVSARTVSLAPDPSGLEPGNYSLIATNDMGMETLCGFDLTRRVESGALWCVPNPVNPEQGGTVFHYALEGDETGAHLTLSTLGGVRVHAWDALPLGSGPRTFSWDGRGPQGRPLPTGIYQAILTTERDGRRVESRTKLLFKNRGS